MDIVLNQRGVAKLTAEQEAAYQSLRPGLYLYGYCCGYFGRDSYGDKLITEVRRDQLVVREENGSINSTSRQEIDWLALVESSNQSLAEEGESD